MRQGVIKLTVGHVSVGVMALDQETVSIEDSKAVDDVGAEAVVNVLRVELATACLSAQKDMVSINMMDSGMVDRLPFSVPTCKWPSW